MLVALGFLLATLIALLLAPAYRARAMRLTYKQIRRTLPLTDDELIVERDRLRAHYAVRIHDLETKLEKARLSAARQQVEVNRRDATIRKLESEIAELRAELEQNVNARRVLEQTVMDRLPAVEQKLAETRSLLEQRDRELAAITKDTSKTVRALDEVMQINAQQRAEIERLNGIIATHGMRTRSPTREGRFESEVALRSELEALRAKTREQESLISRLQLLVTAPSKSKLEQVNGSTVGEESEKELERARRDLAEAELALKSANDRTAIEIVSDETLRARLQSLERLTSEQASKIKQLEAALAVYEKGSGEGGLLRMDNKLAMKARLASLQAETEDQKATIEKLRAELAAANERLAFQATQFRDELRRLRQGDLPAPKDSQPAKDNEKASARRSLADRIKEANPALAAALRTSPRPSQKVRSEEGSGKSGGAAGSHPASVDHVEGANGASHSVASAEKEAELQPKASERVDGADGAQQSERLLDRIAGLGKS